MKRSNILKAFLTLVVIAVVAGYIIYTQYIEISPKTLLRNMAGQTKDLTSTEMAMKIALELSGSENGYDFQMSTQMDLNMGITLNPVASQGIGIMSVTAYGRTKKAEMELYMVEEDGQYISYANADGNWIKTATQAPQATEYYLIGLEKYHKSFQLEKKLVEEDGKNCYVLKGKLRGEVLGTLMDTAMNQMDKVVSTINRTDWMEMEVPVEILISEADNYPIKLTIDVESIIKKALGEESSHVKIDSCVLENRYVSFDTLSEIQIPDEIEAEAQDITPNSEENTAADTEEGTKEETVILPEFLPQGAEQPDQLGSDWDDLTVSVNDKVIKLPCTYQEFAATGLVFDEEYGDIFADTLLDPKVSEFVSYRPTDSEYDYLDAVLYNSADIPVAAEDALVTGLSYRDSNTASAIRIVLPGEIKMGSTLDEVTKQYGEPTEVKEEYYTWNIDNEDGGGSLTLRLNEEEGVSYISIKSGTM